jgi:hypothetical protein
MYVSLTVALMLKIVLLVDWHPYSNHFVRTTLWIYPGHGHGRWDGIGRVYSKTGMSRSSTKPLHMSI